MLLSESTLLPAPHKSSSLTPNSIWPPPFFHFFCSLARPRFCGRFEKKCELRWPKMSKRCQKGAQKAHFLKPKASFLGAKFVRVALCESIIIHYVLITLSHQKSMRERTKNRCGNAMCARDAFFPSFICTLCVKVLPKVAPRAPKGSERESKSLPRDTSKS